MKLNKCALCDRNDTELYTHVLPGGEIIVICRHCRRHNVS
jgi:recombinational DNA repair protein (RecF pathway)